MADIDRLLGCNPLSIELADHVALLATKSSVNHPVLPEIKTYPDAVYFNYYKLGVSFQFVTKDGYRPTLALRQDDLKNDKLSLDSIYLYNFLPKNGDSTAQDKSSRSADLAFSPYPISPFILKPNPSVKDKDGRFLSRPSVLEVHPGTTGKDFVKALLEPDRKGGGTGPLSGSIGIWCEWSKDGIMVEFGGVEAKGPHAWEQGKDALWKVITAFTPIS